MALEVGKIYKYSSSAYILEIYQVTDIKPPFYHIHTLVGTGTLGGSILTTGNIQANSTLFETTATTPEEFQDLYPEFFI